MNKPLQNNQIAEGQFIQGQESVADLLEEEKDDVTSLRRYFVSENNFEIEKPASIFYSTLSIMNLEDCLEKDGIDLTKKGDYYPVPSPEKFETVGLGFTYTLSNDELEQFRKHFEDQMSFEDLKDNGARFSDQQEYSTGYTVSRELGVLNNLDHAWTKLEVNIPVAYLTDDVENLVLIDLERYASTILEQEYDTVKSRVGNQDAVAGI